MVHNIHTSVEPHYVCTCITVTHFSFFVEFLFPSFGKVSLHISKLVKGGHKVTTMVISG